MLAGVWGPIHGRKSTCMGKTALCVGGRGERVVRCEDGGGVGWERGKVCVGGGIRLGSLSSVQTSTYCGATSFPEPLGTVLAAGAWAVPPYPGSQVLLANTCCSVANRSGPRRV